MVNHSEGVATPQVTEMLCAGLSFLVVTFVPVLWLFGRDPELRRQVILAVLGCAFACLAIARCAPAACRRLATIRRRR